MKTASVKHTMERLADKFPYGTSKNGYYFPSDDIDPKDKKGEWCLAWQEALWYLFTRNGCYNSPTDYNGLNLLRLYGAGRQPNNIYKDLLIGDETINPTRRAFLSTNWKVFSPMPKFKRIIRGRFESQDYMASANAIDPTSQAKKEDQMWEIWYNSQYGEVEKDIRQIVTGIQDDGAKSRYIAKSLEELDMFNQMGGFKLKEEAEIEVALEATDYLSDIKTIKQKVLDDLVDFGKAAYRDYYDHVSGTVKKEYVDWENLIIDYSNETDFKDIRFWSYIKFETINNVRVRSGLSEVELVKIATLNCGYWGNMDGANLNAYSNNFYRNAKGIRVYDQFRIPVMISEWISTDTEYKLAKTKKGVEAYYPQEHGKVYNSELKKTKTTSVNNVYNSTWIIGSKVVYDDGLSLNIARPNPKEPKLSIHAQVLPGESITSCIIPNLDQLALIWLKYQSNQAQAAPAGYNFDLTQMEGIDIGLGGDMKPLDLVMLYRQTGDTFERSVSLQGKMQNNGRPVKRNEGGMGQQAFSEILQGLDMQFRYIADLTGIDLISGASMKPSEITATEVNKAGAATSDALQPLFTSWVQMQEHAGQTVACKIQRAIKYHPLAKAAYEGMLGRIGAKILSIGADTTTAEFGIKIELKSNEKMTAFAMESVLNAMAAASSGGIGVSPAEGYYFVDMIQRGRVKHAMALFNYKMEKNKADASKLQQENMQENRKTALAQEQMKQQGTQQAQALKGAITLKVEAEKALLQMQVDNNSHLHAIKERLIEQILAQQPTPEQTAPAA